LRDFPDGVGESISADSQARTVGLFETRFIMDAGACPVWDDSKPNGAGG
jgi:hypothetical protein